MNSILRRNAIPVYGFLSLINAEMGEDESLKGKKILDCGAGGILPPLTLFAQHGLEASGIDISDVQLQRAAQFCVQNDVSIDLRKGSMLEIPFEDEVFDYVYEHYSMCHLTKTETTRAINEMFRVLKKGGLGFLGVISMDTWPKTSYGEEQEPGQFLGLEHGEETFHTMFTDEEADDLVANWEIIRNEKQIIFMRNEAEEISFGDWMTLGQEIGCSAEDWESRYAQRINYFQYTHNYYFIRKPA
ncbi:MAG: class I SAM-dependent methyltransferase [Anaerolineaceae bacterium]|nr:class I SAM-dependent methyltransferase [Anaerolineaceae bacterium]